MACVRQKLSRDERETHTHGAQLLRFLAFREIDRRKIVAREGREQEEKSPGGSGAAGAARRAGGGAHGSRRPERDSTRGGVSRGVRDALRRFRRSAWGHQGLAQGRPRGPTGGAPAGPRVRGRGHREARQQEAEDSEGLVLGRRPGGEVERRRRRRRARDPDRVARGIVSFLLSSTAVYIRHESELVVVRVVKIELRKCRQEPRLFVLVRPVRLRRKGYGGGTCFCRFHSWVVMYVKK